MDTIPPSQTAETDSTADKAQKPEKPTPWYKQWRTFIEVIVFFFAVAAFFLDRYYLKPNIEVTSGAFELGVPTQLQLDLMAFQMFFEPDKLQLRYRDNFHLELKKLGLSAEKIEAIRRSERATAIKASPPDANLTAEENKLVGLAIFRAMQGTNKDVGQKLPSHAVFFTVRNDGNADGENVRITINVPGTILDIRSFSANEVQYRKDINTCTFTAPSLSPDSTISGLVWLTGIQSNLGSLSISYKNGKTVTQQLRPSMFIEPVK